MVHKKTNNAIEKGIMAKFADRLKAARLQRKPGLSAQKFAESIGIEGPTYRCYERGQAEPGLDNLMRICRALGITPNELLANQKKAVDNSRAVN